jgi:3-hydroxyisobutyrate dehydrogenase/putative dehydrogenase
LIFGADGLASSMQPGSSIILSATVHPFEAEAIGQRLDGSGIDFIDTPVSGGYHGAQTGSLTLMAATSSAVFNRNLEVLKAVGDNIQHVGRHPGQGQTVKACLQGLLGSMFSATFEAAVMAAKSGIDAETFQRVVATSSGGCPLIDNALEKIMDGAFCGTGSTITTMHKDLTIANDHARRMGVPVFMAASAMQLFQAGISKYPNADNWTVTRILEDIVSTEFRRRGEE